MTVGGDCSVADSMWIFAVCISTFCIYPICYIYFHCYLFTCPESRLNLLARLLKIDSFY